MCVSVVLHGRFKPIGHELGLGPVQVKSYRRSAPSSPPVSTGFNPIRRSAGLRFRRACQPHRGRPFR